MKNLSLLLAIVIISIFAACNNNAVMEKAILVNNLVDLDSAKLNTDVKNHSENDLQIDRMIIFNEPSYTFTTYRNDNGKLKAHTDFTFQSDKIFDKATYIWINDSTLNIKMINTKNDSTLTCSLSVFNNGNETFRIIKGTR